MREGQAVLARNVMDDSQLGSRDSKGEILATSVICAPIRREGEVLGLIHLYSTDIGKPTDPDDLEFTLAVADTVGVALENLEPPAGTRRESQPDPRPRTSSCASSSACKARSSARAK